MLRARLGVRDVAGKDKHLPGIPSEAEVKKEGHDVGEMQKLLLQKVEELTLYLLDMNKINQQLQSKYEAMQKENSKLKIKVERLEKNK